MSLQQRLTLFFVLIVILPLAAAGFVIQRVISDEIGERAMISLRPALDLTVAEYNDKSQNLVKRVRGAVSGDAFPRLLQRKDGPALDRYLADRLADTPEIDFLIVTDRAGVMASAARVPRFVPGFPEPAMEQVADAPVGAGRGFARTPAILVRITGVGPVGRLIGGFWIDRSLLSTPTNESGIDLSVVAAGTVIASTAPLRGPVEIEADFSNDFDATIDEPVRAAATQLENNVGIVASTPAAPIEASSRRILTSLLILLGLALLGTTALAYLLARLISQPLEELAQGAAAIAEGRFDHRIPVRSRDEVGQLALAFNDMTARLHDTVGELSHSRDQLQRAVRRVGDTLRATHDMKQMLESVISTAADALEADAAVLWRFSPGRRDELYASISRGIDLESLPKMKVGEGLVGFVAERATSLVIPPPSGAHGTPRPAKGEPHFPVSVATPLYTQDRMDAVLALYRSDPRKHFTEEDVEMVNFLVEQCGVAIENVLLHEEAQRLSITDGLTGTWNRRFLQMQFRQVLATATRFDRPFSILMLDLDNFKQINDTFGHHRGDQILVEFSGRVKEAVREVDTFARYGGEEFICLLQETDVDGAITTAEKIRESIRSEPFGETPDSQIDLTVSIGVASYPQHGESYAALVEAADQAMYRAKQLGRDRVAVAEKLKLVR